MVYILDRHMIIPTHAYVSLYVVCTNTWRKLLYDCLGGHSDWWEQLSVTRLLSYSELRPGSMILAEARPDFRYDGFHINSGDLR